MTVESDFRKELKGRLLADAPVSALAPGRVYSVLADQNAVPPYVVFQVVSAEQIQTHGGPLDAQSVALQVDAYAEDDADATSLRDAIKSSLDGLTGELVAGGRTDIGHCLFTNQTDLYEPETKLHRRSLDFDIFFRN